MKRIFTILYIILPLYTYSQVDSSYISSYPQKLTIRPYFAYNLFGMNSETPDGDKSYYPNNAPIYGIGISVNNTIINFGYGYGAEFMVDKEYGKTKSVDFQIHNYGRRVTFDIFYQKYEGFYSDDQKEIELYPDLKINQYGFHGQYVFNYKRFSYQAAFTQNEKQLKSAGSLLAGVGIYQTEILSDSSFLYNGEHSFSNFQFGVSAGYAYTWVLGKYWTINVSGTVGINFGSEKMSTFGKQQLEVYPTVFPRLSAGYSRTHWALSFTYVGNITIPSLSDESSISLLSGGIEFAYIRRFDKIPFINR
ncbi:MAG: DUF4421 domain-containing protein [Candidatus Azobacteroides sp.]|nr:DUF4421 domain-containing protein [Candidatus Azobacteroides sp.]